MLIEKILAGKGDVRTVPGGVNILEAAQLMMSHKIGSLVIVGAEKRVIGIITERDFMRLVAEKRADALNLTVAEVMTRDPVTCKVDMPMEGVMGVMTAQKFRHMPVVDAKQCLIGIVSIGDIVKFRLEEMGREQQAMRDYIQTA